MNHFTLSQREMLEEFLFHKKTRGISFFDVLNQKKGKIEGMITPKECSKK
jgi:predicted transcriptional regulator